MKDFKRGFVDCMRILVPDNESIGFGCAYILFIAVVTAGALVVTMPIFYFFLT